MNEDDLIKRYKELSTNSSEKAPEGLWDAIERGLDEDLLGQYQLQLEAKREPAPDDLWDNIERELDSSLFSAYHAQVSDGNQPLPNDVWDAIEVSLDGELIERYKQQLAQRQEKAPTATWDFIQQKLDIDEVWEKISGQLTSLEKRSVWMYYASIAAAATGLIVTVGLGAWMFLGWLNQPQVAELPYTTPPVVEQPSDSISDPASYYQTIAGQPATTALAEVVPTESDAINDFSEPEIQLLLQDGFMTVARLSPNTPKLFIADNRGTQFVLASITPPYSTKPIEQPDQESAIVPFEEEQLTLASGKLGFGFSAGIRNSWLFSNQTYLAITGYNGHRAKMSLFPDMALHIRYQATPRVELEGGLSFSSNVGQSYQQYIYGRFSRMDISLNYMHIELVANYQSRRSIMLGRNTLRFNSTFGFYFASLNRASETIAGEKFDVSHNYKNIDYGVILGQNIDFELPGNITFSPGLRLTWGLPNIHQRLPDSPEFMWRTFNRSLELRLAVFYKIPLSGR